MPFDLARWRFSGRGFRNLIAMTMLDRDDIVYVVVATAIVVALMALMIFRFDAL
jgi:hypothetical protein